MRRFVSILKFISRAGLPFRPINTEFKFRRESSLRRVRQPAWTFIGPHKLIRQRFPLYFKYFGQPRVAPLRFWKSPRQYGS
jgi:hypothetical protein